MTYGTQEMVEQEKRQRFMIMGRKKQREILAAITLGMLLGTGSVFMGAGMPVAQAERMQNGHYTVTNSYEEVTDDNLNYSNTFQGEKYTSTVDVPAAVSGNFIFIKPSDNAISGDFHTGTSDSGNVVNGSVIAIDKGYTGTVDIGLKTSDNPWGLSPSTTNWLELGMEGTHIYGAVIHSDQQGSSAAASATKINVGDGTQFLYQLKDTTDARFYGIYNSHGTLTVGNDVGLNQYENFKFNGYGTVGTSDDGTSSIHTSGIFSLAGASTTVGNSLDARAHIQGKGTVKGVVSGIDSGTINDTERNTLKLGSNTHMEINFKGKGMRSSASDVQDDENAMSVRDIYIANSDFSIGRYANLQVALNENSTAASVTGVSIRNSKTTDDNSASHFQEFASIDLGSAVDQLTGIRASEKSQVTLGDYSTANISNRGYSKQSDAVGVFSNSSLTMGDYVSASNEGRDSNSHDKEVLATAVHGEGNSQVAMGDNSNIQTWTRDKNVQTVANINLADSQMTIGKKAKINAFSSNLDYDPDSVVYGANVFKTSRTAAGVAKITIGEDSNIRVITNNFGQTVGLRNTMDGTASLGDGSAITVTQTATGIRDIEDEYNVQPEEIQQGHSGSIAGYQGYQAKKTTFGKNVTISVTGNTDTDKASAYGSDNADGELETGDNLTVTIDTKGYAASYGLSTVGEDSDHTGTTAVGKDLTINMTSDGTAKGIYNGNTLPGDATTIVEDNPTVTVSAKTAVGVSNIGSQGTVFLGDNATVTTAGTAASYGVLNQHGANTTFNGAATITSHKGSALGNAATSYDEGSLIDITGPGRKLITGNLDSEEGGTIHLDMATGDSVLTGASIVNNGTTSISMSNGSLWNMTDSSAVTNLDLNSGAKVDMTYNPDGYHTLTIDNFSGNGGEFHMKSDLESMTDGDKVHITTSTPGSSGLISVYDKSLATGSQMTGVHHLLMVTDASENATFSGKDLDTGGLWDIVPTVQRGGTFTDASGNVVGTPNEWYLVQTAKKVNKDTQPLVAGVDGTYSLYRMSIDTLRQRLGDLRYRNRSEDKYDIWARNRAGRYAGNGYDSQYNFFQAGLDTMPNEKSAYGFLVERGIASPDYRTGNGKNHTLAGALYGTWLGDSGSYTDVVAKVGRDDTTIHTFGQYPDAASYRAKEQSLSVEYGRTIPRGNKGWFVEPQAQFVFGHLGSNEYTTRRGTRVQEEGFNSAIGRLGFVLGKKQKEGRHPHDFYLKASVLHEFGGDRDYSLQRVNAAGDLERLDGKYSYGDTWYELGLGGNVQLNKNTLFYADVERSFAGDFNKKWQVNAGLNWSF